MIWFLVSQIFSTLISLIESGRALHPALTCAETVKPDRLQQPEAGNEEAGGKKPPYRVLFLCTHNNACSQLAEGILRDKGGNLVEVLVLVVNRVKFTHWLFKLQHR